MNTGKAVYGILSTNSGVTDLVSTRIFPEIAEQEAVTPFIVYQLQSVAPEDTHDGPSKLDEVRFEFICYADTYDQAADVGVKVRAALDRVSGTYNGVNVESVQFNDVDINIEYDPRRYSQVLTFTFRIKRDDFTIAQGTPVTGAQLGQLADVDVDGVTNGQLIAYNSTSGNWEAADDATGNNTLTGLTDTSITTPASGEVLIYDGGEFVNDNIAISNVSGLQAALDAAPDNLRELTDVTISGLADNDYLQYDSASGEWQNTPLIIGRNGEQYTGNYDSEAETLLDGATDTVELYYTAQADGDGLHEDAQTDTATTGFDIRRKLYYAEKAQADPNTSGDWTQFADIADDTTFASAKATLLAYLKARTGGTVPISLKMTWEEVAETPAFTGLLNESYGSGAAAAYSIRRLNGLYTGSAIEVERSSDNTTQDIGFDANGDLDESALTTFCTGTTCKVRTWYDQSQTGGTGSGNDAVQTTHANQPTIYTGGAIVKESGRPAADFDGTNDTLETSNFASLIGAPNFFTGVVSFDDTANQYFIDSDSPGRSATGIVSGNYSIRGLNGGAAQAGKHLMTVSQESANAYLYVDGNQKISNASSTLVTHTNILISDDSLRMDGTIQELTLWSADKSTNRDDIESNIGDYYTQNTPLLDTYTGAAAAYSLRKLRTAYTGDAIRVRRSNDNAETDIGFNVFGELDTVSLAAHCGSNDGFVKTWYDQSGNANDATETTAANQPKIYDSSTGVVTENGKPAMLSDGTNAHLDDGTPITNQNVSFIAVATPSEASDLGGLIGAQSNYNLGFELSQVGSVLRFAVKAIDLDVSISEDVQISIFANYDGSTQGLSVNGTNSTQASSQSFSMSDTVRLMSRGLGTARWTGSLQEVVLYDTEQSSNRTGIESNINTFYSIY